VIQKIPKPSRPAPRPGRPDAEQVFRQFAWNLAGTLAGKPDRPPPKPAPEKG
jgi:hypothetical protein